MSLALAHTESHMKFIIGSMKADTACNAIREAVEELNQEVEVSIKKNDNQAALWALSKIAFLEDQLLLVERRIEVLA